RRGFVHMELGGTRTPDLLGAVQGSCAAEVVDLQRLRRCSVRGIGHGYRSIHGDSGRSRHWRRSSAWSDSRATAAFGGRRRLVRGAGLSARLVIGVAVIDGAKDDGAHAGAKVVVVKQSLEQNGLALAGGTDVERGVDEQVVPFADEIRAWVGLDLVGEVGVGVAD